MFLGRSFLRPSLDVPKVCDDDICKLFVNSTLLLHSRTKMNR